MAELAWLNLSWYSGSTHYWHTIAILVNSRLYYRHPWLSVDWYPWLITLNWSSVNPESILVWYLMETRSTPWVTLDQHSTDTPSTSWPTVGQLLTNFFINSYESAHTWPNINWLLIKLTRCQLCIDRDVNWEYLLRVLTSTHLDHRCLYWVHMIQTMQYF